MVKETVIRLIDDLDGAHLDDKGRTVQFSLEGRAFEIDLSPDNVEKLRSALEPFVSAGRPLAQGGAADARTTSNRRAGTNVASLRQWARNNGYVVSDRGRLPEEVRLAYRAAHG